MQSNLDRYLALAAGVLSGAAHAVPVGNCGGETVSPVIGVEVTNFDLDIDCDSVSDISFRYRNPEMNGSGEVIGTSNSRIAFDGSNGFTPKFAQRLDEGVLANANAVNYDAVAMTLFVGGQTDDGPERWKTGTPGYLSVFFFKNESDVFYAWVEVNVQTDGQGFVVGQYAYNDEPDRDIKTGVTSEEIFADGFEDVSGSAR